MISQISTLLGRTLATLAHMETMSSSKGMLQGQGLSARTAKSSRLLGLTAAGYEAVAVSEREHYKQQSQQRDDVQTPVEPSYPAETCI